MLKPIYTGNALGLVLGPPLVVKELNRIFR